MLGILPEVRLPTEPLIQRFLVRMFGRMDAMRNHLLNLEGRRQPRCEHITALRTSRLWIFFIRRKSRVASIVIFQNRKRKIQSEERHDF